MCVGPLSVWCHIDGRIWRFAVSRAECCHDLSGWFDGVSPPEDLTWKTWIPPKNIAMKLGVRPELPANPVVVRPAETTLVPTSGKFNCFVEVPLSVAVFPAEDPGQVLLNEPVIVLSKTWFGLPTDGEISYALRSPFRQSVDDLTNSVHTVVCPLRIRNRSAETLTIERLCLRVQHLSVFRGEHFLWSNESSVSYRGASDWSRIAYGRGAPAFDNAHECLAPAPSPPTSLFNLRSFNFRIEPL